MATYAIGDVQGCYRPFRSLLETMGWNEARDRLWLVGDLVNRGPQSLEVLRWVHRHRDQVTTVLGNHDLHLLAVSQGLRRHKKRDTFQDVLAAPDAEELLDWLRHRPLAWREGESLLVHAGLFPLWSLAEAESHARAAEKRLQGAGWAADLATTYEKGPVKWSCDLDEEQRFYFVIQALTRLRVCSEAGALDLGFSGEPRNASGAWRPWFELTPARKSTETVIFGHWAALGLLLAPGLVGLDTGCVYGRQLTGVRLEDRAVFQVPGQGAI